MTQKWSTQENESNILLHIIALVCKVFSGVWQENKSYILTYNVFLVFKKTLITFTFMSIFFNP